ncbi:MAG: hypothetical protein JRN12_03550 [Nitrososphaerota archaeon]|jgi:hypothetical protein|nr:hypothetical protein [Nitrososphaerota archaeon]MDG6950905.1 hypothetical protein [Nitrososphaerota archaeon]
MLSISLVFIIVIPVLLALLSAFASKPDESQYGGNPDDYRIEANKWTSDVGLNLQLAGLTTVIASILDRSLYNGIFGYVFVLLYVIGMAFGLVYYREHRYRTIRDIGSKFKNYPFVIGLSLLLMVEIMVFFVYLFG